MFFNEFVNAFLVLGDYLMDQEDEQDLCDYDVEFPDKAEITGREFLSSEFFKLEIDKENNKVRVRLNVKEPD